MYKLASEYVKKFFICVDLLLFFCAQLAIDTVR